MSVKKGFFGLISLALLAIGIQLPVQAQSLSEGDLSPVSYEASEPTFNRVTNDEMTLDAAPSSQPATRLWTPEGDSLTAENLPAENLTAENLTAENLIADPTSADAEAVYAAPEDIEVAQVRRRRRTTRGVAPASDFVGIGADIGTTDDLSFAVISKLSIRPQIAVRPSVLIGNGFAILAPVTYEFNQFNTNAGGFQIRPYAGAGASYVDNDDDSNLGLLLSAGVDVPVSQRFTANAQANYAGLFSDSENFGVTIGVGYNFGGLLR